MNRKAYMRTLEAFAAIILTFVFMMFVIPALQGNEIRRTSLDVMKTAIHDETFRNCVMLESTNAAENCSMHVFEEYLPQTYRNKVEISYTTSFNATGLPAARIFSESAMIAGNMSSYSPRYIRVYYWLR